MGHWTDSLVLLGACIEAVEWARDYDSLTEAWSACERGDWMLWLAGRCSGERESDARRRLVLAACECARLALHHVPAGEERPRLAIESVETWARGEAPIANVRAAAAAAYAAANAASYVAAANAAAASAAYAAASAAYDAAAATADAASAVSARRHCVTFATCADIVRRHYPEPPELPWEAQKE